MKNQSLIILFFLWFCLGVIFGPNFSSIFFSPLQGLQDWGQINVINAKQPGAPIILIRHWSIPKSVEPLIAQNSEGLGQSEAASYRAVVHLIKSTPNISIFLQNCPAIDSTTINGWTKSQIKSLHKRSPLFSSLVSSTAWKLEQEDLPEHQIICLDRLKSAEHLSQAKKNVRDFFSSAELRKISNPSTLHQNVKRAFQNHALAIDHFVEFENLHEGLIGPVVIVAEEALVLDLINIMTDRSFPLFVFTPNGYSEVAANSLLVLERILKLTPPTRG